MYYCLTNCFPCRRSKRHSTSYRWSRSGQPMDNESFIWNGVSQPTLKKSSVWVKKLKTSLLSVYRSGDTWWAASDLGWVVGHEYICYSPLLAGLTTVVYEGKPVGTPDAGQFFRSAAFFRRKEIMNDCWLYFRVISEYDVNGFFTAPTALRAIKMADPQTLEGSKYPIKR